MPCWTSCCIQARFPDRTAPGEEFRPSEDGSAPGRQNLKCNHSPHFGKRTVFERSHHFHAVDLRLKIATEEHSLFMIIRIGAVPQGQAAFSAQAETESELFDTGVLSPEIGIEHVEPCVRDQPFVFFQAHLSGRRIITSAGMKIALRGLIHSASGEHERLKDNFCFH